MRQVGEIYDDTETGFRFIVVGHREVGGKLCPKIEPVAQLQGVEETCSHCGEVRIRFLPETAPALDRVS